MHLTTLPTLAVLALTQLITPSLAEGGYASTCNGASIQQITGNGVFLDPSCGNGHGGYQSTSIKLGTCFGNNNGHLVFSRNGAFGTSCNQIGLSGSTLKAACEDDGGNYISTSIDLNSYIGNVNGALVC